jgi:glycosyltransferase involved in cell wall biosynthesis
MISVIIPTYKEPQVLDLCLRSAIEGQKNKNQIIKANALSFLSSKIFIKHKTT